MENGKFNCTRLHPLKPSYGGCRECIKKIKSMSCPLIFFDLLDKIIQKQSQEKCPIPEKENFFRCDSVDPSLLKKGSFCKYKDWCAKPGNFLIEGACHRPLLCNSSGKFKKSNWPKEKPILRKLCMINFIQGFEVYGKGRFFLPLLTFQNDHLKMKCEKISNRMGKPKGSGSKNSGSR
jgi:hypothetical protein